MVSHHSANFGGRRNLGSGDILLLVVKEQNSICPCLNLSLVFISKAHGLEAHEISF